MRYSPTLYHVHDPMCSWCWGYRKVWDRIRANLPSPVALVNVVGGLARDSELPMPADQQAIIASYWQQVADTTGAEFNFDFWRNCQPRRSTYPACRAVLASKNQGREQAMIDAIQRAYYLRALNPSDNETLIQLAAEIELEVPQFTTDINSQEIESQLQEDFALRRRIGVTSFPSLVMAHNGVYTPLAINYSSGKETLAEINNILNTEASHSYSPGQG